MSELNLDDCLRKWRRKYGEETSGRSYGNVYYAIPVKSRRYLLIVFLRWMKARGISREELSRPSFIAKYLKILFGDAPAVDKEKRARGHAAALEEFQDVLCVEVFDKKSRIKRKSKMVREPAPASLSIREDVTERPYDADESVLDEEFVNQLKEIADE